MYNSVVYIIQCLTVRHCIGPHLLIFEFRCFQSCYYRCLNSSTYPHNLSLQTFVGSSKQFTEFKHDTVIVSPLVVSGGEISPTVLLQNGNI